MTNNAQSRSTADGERLRIARRRLEVVASVETMAAFLRANTHDLADTVVLLDGVVFRTVTSAP